MSQMSARTELKWKGGKIANAQPAAAARGVTKAALLLKQDSVEKAPVDQGDLRGTANVVNANPTANPTAVLVFPEPYAAIQHEKVMNHTTGAAGEPAGQDHYVESNFTEHRDDYLALIGGEIRDAFAAQ